MTFGNLGNRFGFSGVRKRNEDSHGVLDISRATNNMIEFVGSGDNLTGSLDGSVGFVILSVGSIDFGGDLGDEFVVFL